ncbi:MAG: hypothetical protein MUO54_08465 [Anaerolineales bacterium]|nr:hypothetical protein [Anaerolineales bacterium]
MNNELNKTNSFWHRLGLAFRKILRFLVILAIIAGIGVALYFTAPYLYGKFILPIETNTTRLSEIESGQEAGMGLLEGQISDLRLRQIDLENDLTENTISIVELQGQVQVLKTDIQAHSQALKQLQAIQTTLDELAVTSSEHEALLVYKDSVLVDLQRQVLLSRSIELLSRSRLYLSQNNNGLAEQDVLAARDILSELATEMPFDEPSTFLQGVIARLDLALSNLPSFPVIAADDVDIAWQLLVNNFPEQLKDISSPAFPSETQTPILNAAPTVKP